MSLRAPLRLFLCAALTVALSAAAADGRESHEAFFQLNMGDLKSELADARRAGKKGIFVMFEQEGCPGCLYMKRTVLSRADVQKFYGDRFVSLALDVNGSVPLTDFSGRQYTEKSYAQAAGVKATPTLVFYDLQGTEAARVVGATQTPGEFLLLGEFVDSGAWRNHTFSAYKAAHTRKKGS
jgi:thioredoxin-related protein